MSIRVPASDEPTAPNGPLSTDVAADGPGPHLAIRLAFEIDHVDYEDHTGWSVVAVGTGEVVEDPAELGDAGPFWNPKPWAAGNRVLYVRMRWTGLTGRRIGAGWTWENELPVRRP